MTIRKRLDRETFIREGHKRNAEEMAASGKDGNPIIVEQISPAHAWKVIYGSRKFVWLDMRMEAVNADPLVLH